MGARKGISGGKCSPWCAIKEKLDSLWDKTHNAFTHVNGYEADGSQNLKINGSEGVIVETISGNEIRLVGATAEPYTAQAPIIIDPDTKTVSINMDAAPTSGSGNAVSSGGVYAADQTLQEAISDVESDLSTETASRIAGIQNLHGDIQAEQSARLQDVAALTRQISTETTARANADNALGARIDGVINGTTPPTTISGVLPIENGGTGSNTKNFVDLSTNQTKNGLLVVEQHDNYPIRIKNTSLSPTTIDSSGHGFMYLDNTNNMDFSVLNYHISSAGDGPIRLQRISPNNSQLQLDIWYSSNGHSFLEMSQTHNGTTTNYKLYEFRGHKMHILIVNGEGKRSITLWHRYPCDGTEDDIADQISAYYSSPITRNPSYTEWKIRLIEGDITDGHKIVVRSVIWERTI